MGTMDILKGVWTALRNPKAHSNDEVESMTYEECLRRLMIASHLMYKIDNAVIIK